MCKWHGGSYEGNVPVTLAHPKTNGQQVVYVDPCIQHIIQALNNAGLQTLNCCCGHGIRPGWIALEDGRQIIIADSIEDVHKMEESFPSLVEGSIHE